MRKLDIRAVRLAAVGTLLALRVATAFGQDHPNHRRGGEVPTAYSLGQIEALNLWNGNLTLAIPLGLSYPVGGGLSYQLSLHYNSTVWEFDEGPFNNQSQPTVTATPDPHSRAGLGWVLEFGGRLHAPQTPPYNDGNGWLLVEPDGSRRIWMDQLHEGDINEPIGDGVLYTRDGSYLRLNTQLAQWVPGELTRKVESPDGTIRYFNGAGNLSSIRDRFNNSVTVTALVLPAVGWQIRDSVGSSVRTHTINQQTLAGLPQAQVSSIRLAKFGGGDALYSFEYELEGNPPVPIEIARHSRHTSEGLPGGLPQQTRMPLLKSVTLPDGSKLAMTYYTATESFQHQGQDVVNEPGMLKTLTLPTLASYDWKYRIYGFGTPVSPVDTLFTTNEGVAFKTASATLGGSVVGTWKYESKGRPDGSLPPDINREHIRWVTDPLGFTTVHYFENNSGVWNHGLPFTTQITDTATGKFLSRQVYAGVPPAGPLRRSEYVTFAADPFGGASIGRENQRLVSQKTVFHDDANRFTTMDQSDFDGLGHFRQVDLGGNFDAGNTKTTIRNYNPGRGTYPGGFTMLTTATPWLLGIYDRTKITEGGQTFHTHTCFNSLTGFLEGERTLETTLAAGSYGGRDLLMRATPTAQGDVERQEFFGGDVDPNPLPANPPCGSGSNTRDYALRHTYAAGGALATSRYITAASVDLPFLVVDQTIDQATGLPSSSRDTATVETQFQYDNLGRLQFVKPVTPGLTDGWTEYVYSRATGVAEATAARVEILHRGVGGAGVLAKEVQRFDSFGRLWLEEKLMRDNSTSQRKTLYNALGWPESVSSLGDITEKTEYLNYDPFGRPTRIVAPDGGDVTLAYQGSRQVERTLSIGTTFSSGNVTLAPSSTTELYDRQGRLYRLLEPSGTNGAIVTSTHSYNAVGKLIQVVTGIQTRSFDYDGRGLLKSENHPEKQPRDGEPAGTPDVAYKEYDARGHVLHVVDGDRDLRTTYDAAERLDEVRQTNVVPGTDPVLQKLVYWTDNDVATGDYRLGKLRSATRHNHFSCNGHHDAQVVETYTYRARRGRVSQRDLRLIFDGANGEAFSQTFAWTALGRAANVGYPQCTGSATAPNTACAAPSPRTVSFTYVNGWLTDVGGFASNIGYSANGLVATVLHSNGIRDVQSEDPDSMERSLRHYAEPAAGGTRLWDSGDYDYDEAGNVTRMGSGYFLYDKVSRLKDGHISTAPLGGTPLVSQTTSYDSFGSILNFGGTSAGLTPTDSATNRLCTSACGGTCAANCGGTASYSACGELLAWGSQAYEYDHFGMLRRSNTGAEEWLHFYTADDERVWSYRTGTTPYNRWTLRDLDGRVLREYASDIDGWRVVSDYIYRDGQLLAAATPNPTETKHFHLDHLGTPRAISNSAGVRTAFHAYYPFGEEATSSTQDSERLRFTSHEVDFNSQASLPQSDDLNYMHARHHSPITGRFLSFDPVGGNPRAPQSWNRYAYVLGNPMKYVDPYGLTPFDSFFPFAMSALPMYEASIVVTGAYYPTRLDQLYLRFLRDFAAHEAHSLRNIAVLRPGDFSVARGYYLYGQGLGGFADGVVPFADPLTAMGVVDPGEVGVEEAMEVGEITRNVEFMLAPMGSTTLFGKAKWLNRGYIRLGHSRHRGAIRFSLRIGQWHRDVPGLVIRYGGW